MKTLIQALILATFSYLCKGQCLLVYTQQPPTTLECSPYDNSLVGNHNQEFRLRISCTAEKVENSGVDNFDLFWYRRRSSDGLVENLGTGTVNIDSSTMKRIVMVEIPGLSIVPFSEEMPGDYWCQAVVSNSSGQYLLTESNVLTVLRPENYTGLKVCDTVKFENIETCANITQLSSLVSPSLPSFLTSLSLPTTSFMAVILSQSSKSPVSPTVISHSKETVISAYSPVLRQSSSITPLSLATTTSQGSPSMAPYTQPFLFDDIHSPALSSSSPLASTSADDLLPVIIAASVASVLLVMIMILMSVVILMLCRRSGQQKTGSHGGRGALAVGGIGLSSYSSNRGLRNSTSSGKWLLHSTSVDKHPSTATSPPSVTAFLHQEAVEKEIYADPESTPAVTSMFVSLANTSEGGQHQYEDIEPKMKEHDTSASPVYAFTEQSSSLHKEFGENGYNTLTHSLGPPANHYNKLDHTLPKKQNGSDTFYSSLNESKDAFYNSLEELDDNGCDRYANVCDPPATNGHAQQLLFDDPNYSPLRSKKAQPVALDPKYTGDYERAPDYVIHKQEMNLEKNTVPPPNDTDSSTKKHNNDYVPMSPPNVAIKPLRVNAAVDAKYIGEYERAPDYIPPSQAPGQKQVKVPTTFGAGGMREREKLKDHDEYISMSPVSSPADAIPTTGVMLSEKYKGDYERDPNYWPNRPSSPPADYQSLADSTMDSPHHYAHPGKK